MARKILWLSRHRPHWRQIQALRDIFGVDTAVEQVSERGDPYTIADRFFEGGYDDMVIVAPLSVISVLCKKGVSMLWAEMATEHNPRMIDFLDPNGRGVRFIRFHRIKSVELESLGIQGLTPDE